MHRFKFLSILCAIIFCVSMLYGCGSDGNKGDLSIRYFPVTPEPQPQPEPEPSDISLSIDKLDLEHFAGTSDIQLKGDYAWNISFRESSDIKNTTEIDWIKAEPSSGTGDCNITLTFEDNRILFEDRACELVVTSESGTTLTVPINQECLTYDNARAGDKIVFGRYPQAETGDIDNPDTYESLTWVVDSKNNEELYMTTENVIDYRVMSTPDFFINSLLRKFLTGDFYDKAFNDEEKSIIVYFADDNLQTKVSIFSPSVSYFQTDESRLCKPTEYAVNQGIGTSTEGYTSYWIDYYQSALTEYLSIVEDNGSISTYFSQHKRGVRPRIRLNLNK